MEITLSDEQQALFEKLAQLLGDYRAALEIACKTYMMPEGQAILDILFERGEAIGAWPSEEESKEIIQPSPYYLLCFGRHAACTDVGSLKELIERYVIIGQTFTVHFQQGDKPLGRAEYERTEHGIRVRSEEGQATGLHEQLGFSGACPIIETKLTEERQTD